MSLSTKDRIIEAVIKLLTSDYNYDKISMSGIADAVGIGKSTIYEYFESRESLLLEATSLLFEDYIERMAVFQYDKMDFHEAFCKLVQELIILNANKDSTIKFFLLSNPHPETVDKEIIKKHLANFNKCLTERITKVFDLGREQGVIKNATNEQTTFILSSLFIGSLCQHLNTRKFSNEEYIELLYQTVLKIV